MDKTLVGELQQIITPFGELYAVVYFMYTPYSVGLQIASSVNVKHAKCYGCW